MVRFALRADRVRLTVWLVALTLYQLASTSSVKSVYATATDRQTRADLMASPAAALMSGPGYGLGDYSYGAMFENEQTQYLIIAVVILNVTILVRHTRAEEESGRAEVLRSNVIGRHAMLSSALLVSLSADVLVALGTTIALVANGFDAGPSLVLGIGIGSTGFVFAAVAAVIAQTTEHARAATGWSLAMAGVAFALRALGDTQRVGGSAFSWASPFAWVQQTRPFVDLRLWPLVLLPITAITLCAVAYALSVRRDVGAGLFAARRGRAEAPRTLSGPAGLAWRLQRSSILGWTVGLAVFSAAFGGIVGAAKDALAENATVAELLTKNGLSITDGLISTLLSMLALVVGAFTVSSILRMTGEETGGRTDTVLTAGISRTRWLVAQLMVCVPAAAVMLCVIGLCLGLSASGSTSVGRVMVGAVLFLPAVLVVVGLAVALYGKAAGATRIAGVAMGYIAAVAVVGVIVKLPAWAMNISPFQHVPRVSGAPVPATSSVILLVLAATLVTTGIVSYSRRDVRNT